MKALVLENYNRFVWKDVPTPQYGPEDVLVRIRACGICGSDVHGMDGKTGRRIPPVIMGHEAAGEIVAVGGNIRDFSVGECVTFDSTVYCNDCHFCRRGYLNLCEQREVLGVSCQEYRRDGALAEYIVVPGRILYRLPANLEFDKAVFAEPLSVALHAVVRSGLAVNDTAVVVGTGMIGLLIIQVLRATGCGNIIAVDLDRQRLDLACKLGADIAVDAAAVEVVSKVRQLTFGRGADRVFEVVGLSATVQTATACARKGGCLTLVGNLDAAITFPLQAAVTREISIHCSCASNGEYPVSLKWIATGTIDVDSLISVRAPMSAGDEWFQRLYDNTEGLLKVILTL